LILSTNVTIKFEESFCILCKWRNRFFYWILFIIKTKIICRYDAQNALNNLSIQELSFLCNMSFHF
jgi:hypothetical protein